jgi:hypothetical protein
MTKEPRSKGKRKETKRPEGAEEEPQVFAVQKDLDGWRFNRREFLAAAATAVAAATAATVVAKDKSSETTLETAETVGSSIPLTMTAPAVTLVGPGESFTQVWRFANNSDTAWCRGVKLYLESSDQALAPATVPLPDIAPGKEVAVQVKMVAPAETGTYQGAWRLMAADNAVPVASGPFVVLNGCIAESAHPYANDTDQTWQVTNPDTNAQNTRVHFSQVEVETGYDNLILRDETGQEHQRISGSYPSGLWSNPVPGRIVQVQLVTDSIVTAWGFCLDQVETAHVVYLPIIIEQPTPTPSPTPRPTSTPCSCDVVICTCDTIHYWHPN